jgi:hypothetical protein
MPAIRNIERFNYTLRLNKSTGFIRRAMAVLVLLPLLMLFFSNTAYRHQHILPDGTIIEHSHFHRAHPGESHGADGHHHTEKEFLLLALVTDSQYTATSVLWLPDVIVLQEADIKTRHTQRGHCNYSVANSFLRAPPIQTFGS